MEHMTKSDDYLPDTYKYSIYSPNKNKNKSLVVVNLLLSSSIEKYKEYIISQLRELNDRTGSDSRTRYIAIHKIRILCYYMVEQENKSFNSAMHWLQKKNDVYGYDGTYKICWFAIPAYYDYYKEDPRKKRVTKNMLESKGKMNFIKFYELEGTANTKANQKLLKEYPGFQPEYDTNEFMKIFNLPSIRVFKAGKKPGSCFVDYIYKNSDHERLGDDYQ
jgi:hypothetical protein